MAVCTPESWWVKVHKAPLRRDREECCEVELFNVAWKYWGISSSGTRQFSFKETKTNQSTTSMLLTLVALFYQILLVHYRWFKTGFYILTERLSRTAMMELIQRASSFCLSFPRD